MIYIEFMLVDLVHKY